MLFGISVVPIAVMLGTCALLFGKSFKVSGGDYAREFASSCYPDEFKKDVKSAEATFGRMGKTITSILFYVVINLLHLQYLDYRVAIFFLIFTFVSTVFWVRSITVISNDLEALEVLDKKQES